MIKFYAVSLVIFSGFLIYKTAMIIFDQKNELLHGTACLGYGVYHTMFVLATIYGVPLIEKLVKTL